MKKGRAGRPGSLSVRPVMAPVRSLAPTRSRSIGGVQSSAMLGNACASSARADCAARSSSSPKWKTVAQVAQATGSSLRGFAVRMKSRLRQFGHSMLKFMTGLRKVDVTGRVRPSVAAMFRQISTESLGGESVRMEDCARKTERFRKSSWALLSPPAKARVAWRHLRVAACNANALLESADKAACRTTKTRSSRRPSGVAARRSSGSRRRKCTRWSASSVSPTIRNAGRSACFAG